jgi:hypothetical protein
MTRKSQISFEFILIFTIVFMALMAFLYIMNTRIAEITDEQDYLIMQNLANNIKNEIALAASVSNNYLREFDIPAYLRGSRYRMVITDSDLTIRMLDSSKEYYTVFPVEVKGNFVEDITPDVTSHCITKNEYDGIRIARNQASITSTKESVSEGEEFDVYVSLNCVKKIIIMQASISYDSDVLDFVSYEIITRHTHAGDNPLFSDKLLEIYYINRFPFYNYPGEPAIKDGRFTFGFSGKDCTTGSGNVAKLKFKAISVPHTGYTSIEFDPTIGTDNLQLWDCFTTSTSEELPNARVGTKIMIT